jgi:hypothetical protein
MAEPERTHEQQVTALLKDAAAEHVVLLAHLPPDIARALPVDAQGLTRAIDHLAAATGFSTSERQALIAPHAVNPAVLHARVFGGAGLTDSTVVGAFVEGARVRAEGLAMLADEVGGEPLGIEVRGLLADNPPPVDDAPGAGEDLVSTYKAQERAALLIARALDA